MLHSIVFNDNGIKFGGMILPRNWPPPGSKKAPETTLLRRCGRVVPCSCSSLYDLSLKAQQVSADHCLTATKLTHDRFATLPSRTTRKTKSAKPLSEIRSLYRTEHAQRPPTSKQAASRQGITSSPARSLRLITSPKTRHQTYASVPAGPEASPSSPSDSSAAGCTGAGGRRGSLSPVVPPTTRGASVISSPLGMHEADSSV